jgi:hypothetical protein
MECKLLTIEIPLSIKKYNGKKGENASPRG